MFTIQQTKTETMIWAKMHDGRKVCVFVCTSRFEASLWIENAISKFNKKP